MEHSYESKPRVCFEVEKVIGVSSAGNVRSYQVRYAPVWVNSVHLVGCEHLIEQFIVQQQEEEQQQKQQHHHQSEMDYPVVVLPSDSNEVSGQYSDLSGYQNISNDYGVPEFNNTNDFQNIPSNGAIPEMLDTEQSINRETEGGITNFSAESIRVDGEDYTLVVGNSAILPSDKDQTKTTAVPTSVFDIDISNVKLEEAELDCHTNTTEKTLNPPVKSDEKKPYKNIGSRASFLEMHDDSLADLKSIQTNILETHNPKPMTSQKYEPCDMPSSSNSKLISHVDAGGGKTLYNCVQCGKTSLQKREMLIHVRSHTGQKPFTCELCGKSFSVKCSLKRHRRLHTGEKPFSCDKCDKRFTFHNQLKRHSVVHSEEIEIP